MPRLLNASQLRQLRASIALRHQAYLVSVLGDAAVPPKVLRAIRKAGLYKAKIRDPMRSAYLFGRAAVRDDAVLTMRLPAFEAYLKAHQVAWSAAQKKGLAGAQKSFETHLRKLGPLWERRVVQAVQTAHKALQAALKKIPNATPAQVLQARDKVAHDLVEAMQAITRQQLYAAQRIVDTETNNAYQLGRAHGVAALASGGDPWVFKRPRPDACSACKSRYLEKDGKTPKLFRLSALSANGSNVGRARPDRLPVVGSLHPNCRCELSVLPEGFAFDSTGTMRFVGSKRAAHG